MILLMNNKPNFTTILKIVSSIPVFGEVKSDEIISSKH